MPTMKNAAVVLLSLILFSAQLRAATVTSIADSGPGSLREAIAAAAPGETIDFAVTGTILLTSGELVIDKDLVLLGPGADQLTIGRLNVPPLSVPPFRVLNIQSGIVVVSGLTVAGGAAQRGAGIHNETTSVLRDCVIRDNAVFERGGGINNLGTLTMSNCIVASNRASVFLRTGSGGGIHNEGTLTMVDCAVSGNSALAGSLAGGFGGGINNIGTLTLSNSVVQDNLLSVLTSAEDGGGGIFNRGTLSLQHSTIRRNSARCTSGMIHGGGLANRFGTVTVVNSTISGNSAIGRVEAPGDGRAQGGGVFSFSGTVTIENSTISGNTVRGLSGFGALDISSGAGIFNTVGFVGLTHSTVTDNVAEAPATIGGLANFQGVAGLYNTIMAGNSPEDLFNTEFALILSDGFNLIGSTNGPVPPGPNDRFHLTADDLRLGPLQNNGGPTETHALLCDSPAIDAGNNAGAPPTDQRGFARIVGGIIDIGAFELNNIPPTIACPGPITLGCAPPNGQTATLSVDVTDLDGDALVAVWTVNGQARQTNFIAASGPPTFARVDFTTHFDLGAHEITVSVTDPAECVATCSIALDVAELGDLYPIALHRESLENIPVGGEIRDIYNGIQPGNFGWLTWAGSPSEPKLVKSLTPPGDSRTYINPFDRSDRSVSVGDWVQGKPGISNSDKVRKALNTLKQIDIVVPVWDRAIGKGNTSLYQVSGFARVRITDYQLPKQNRISARFLGFVECE
jgi:hypothetical protein